MSHLLTLRAVARSRDGAIYGSGPVMLYEVRGLPEGQKISIRNVRAQSHAPVWEIGRHTTGFQTVWAGVFSTAEEALAKLKAEIEAAVRQ